MHRASRGALAALLLCLLPSAVLAQGGKLPWEEYERLVEKGRSIAALDAGSLFGEQVDLYSGALSFSATDVSVPGNNALPVAIGRKLSIDDREAYAGHDYAFADWDLDIPNVNGVFAPTWHDNRCSQAQPPTIQSRVSPSEYWAGNHAELPGGGEMLQANIERTKPSTGGPYKWLTQGDTYFSCLGTIANGSGEGFLAIAKDGTKYWLNHMAQYLEPEYINVVKGATPEQFTVQRRKNVLYATRVEDRFGNWVTYAYSNSSTQPVRLTRIESSDGRFLNLQYNTSGYVSSVSDGVRTWTYQYSGGSLTSVVLPDASSWTLNLAGLSNATIEHSSGDPRSCFSFTAVISGEATGSLTHPSGATATFTVRPGHSGRTNVPGLCSNYQPEGTPGNDKNDDYTILPYRWASLVIKSKQMQGPGLTPGQWDYAFSSNWSWQYPPGHTEPICQTDTCLDPFCLSDSCAGKRTMAITHPDGEWERYTFGNSYRYNEGKLLKHEVGADASHILKTTTYSYNYATSGQPYPARIGTSPQPRGGGFTAEYPRPLVKTVIVQDGGAFTWEVAKGCPAPDIHCLDSLARPTRVNKSGIVSTGSTGDDPVLPPSPAPTLTAPATSYTGSYTLSWTSISQASAYELQQRLGSGAWDSIQNSGATTAPVSGNASGSWSYQVRACNTAGCSAWSAIKTTVVTLPPEGVPTLTAPASNTTGSYTVSWTAVTAATRYELDQRKDGGAWSTIHNASGTSKALNAQTNGSYDYRVRACSDGGCAAYSAIASTVVSLPLGAPTLSVSSPVTQGQTVGTGWTAVSGATQYQLERSRNGGAFSTVYTGPSTSASVASGLFGTWTYRVKACSASGCGAYSAEKIVIVEPDNS